MSKLLVITHDEVERLLPMADCIDLMEKTLVSLERGDLHQPLRMIVPPPDSAGLMALMPAYRSKETPAFGLKAICVFPGNAARGLDAHQGGVLLFSGETGELLSLINASAITAIRTAAVSAVATRALARRDAARLAIIGAGVQARSHLSAMACICKLESVKVVSRTPEHAESLVKTASHKFSFPIKAVTTAQEALDGSDLIVTVTNAREPVIKADWISPGAHINAVGTYSPAGREIDSATMAAASLFVDRKESAVNEAGDYLLALAEGAIEPNHIKADLGEVLTGKKVGRQSRDEITLFKSLGLAIEDLAAAEYIYDQALRNQLGTHVDL
jgi:ornithine cyclodeaminase/alanine dehydrogenase-like protein (mu-crystallin family)